MKYIQLENSTEEVVSILNKLLSNYQLYYQNMRGFHWNLRGENFFELHVKFEEFYNNAALSIDEIAERILTLGGTPLHTYSDYESNADVQVYKNQTEGKVIMEYIWEMHNALLAIMHDAVKVADEKDDEGTQDLLSPMISALEKTNWMVGAWLKK